MGLLHLINASTLPWFLQNRKGRVFSEHIHHQTISISSAGQVFTFCGICLARTGRIWAFCVHNTELFFLFIKYMFSQSYLDKLSGRLLGSEIYNQQIIWVGLEVIMWYASLRSLKIFPYFFISKNSPVSTKDNSFMILYLNFIGLILLWFYLILLWFISWQ